MLANMKQSVVFIKYEFALMASDLEIYKKADFEKSVV